MQDAEFTVGVMNDSEVRLAVDWAAEEGWNPGFEDARCFGPVDPGGFFIGKIDGVPASTISVVNYDPQFSFLGFYIVRPDLRGNGYGLRTWQAAIGHAGSRIIGLDGVVSQQENYAKSGFRLAYRNVRFGGTPLGLDGSPSDVVFLRDVPLRFVEAADDQVFPASRPGFLRAWIVAPGHLGRALVRDGELVGWGIIRPCRRGHKVGPLIARDRSIAERVFASLVASVNGGEIFIDVPEPNEAAMALAQEQGLEPVFQTARMYTGPVNPVDLSRIFGITSFELG